MSDGLDFDLAASDGRALITSVSMEAAFASVIVAEELKADQYPILRSLWGYRSTPVPLDEMAAFQAEVIRLIKAALRRGVDHAVVDELDRLLLFAATAERLGLGMFVSGP